ncbi:MAG: hypothetical protein P0116_11665 [Candidatus Nitrosocosmicus sp.]|nr:hypothetical protein [Candidatus Nitrosocosmicus sp.]
MKLNAKLILTVALVAGVLSVGLLSYNQIQQTNAQSSGLSGFESIPEFNMFKEMIGDNNIAAQNANEDYLDIDKAVVAKAANKVQAVLQAHGHIPKDGSGGAFGYGILTTKGLSAIMVSTTHAGVLDSEDQRNANDPRWHNHYVSLGDDTENCGANPAVTSITFQSPGKVVVNKNKAVMSNLPSTFTGTNALTSAPLTLSPGTNVQDVVSFVLEPIFNNAGGLEAVCVNDITSADKIIKN